MSIDLEIAWNTLDVAEWEARFAKIRRSNLLQSYDYTRSACPVNRQKARWGLTMIEGREAGLVQVLEAGLFGNMIHGVVLDRGPLWFDGFGTQAHFQAFLHVFNREFPACFGRRRRFIPEMENSADTRKILENAGFKAKTRNTYETLWLDLKKDDGTLRAALKKSWRGSLKKAEKNGFDIEWDDTGKYSGWFLAGYLKDRRLKKYPGPPPALLRSLIRVFSQKGRMIIGRASIKGRPCAGVLILCHGSGATYQVGWTDDFGREKAATHLLLWQSLGLLRKKGIKDFDLGGINDETAAGVKKFKEGMGGTRTVLPGLYM